MHKFATSYGKLFSFSYWALPDHFLIIQWTIIDIEFASGHMVFAGMINITFIGIYQELYNQAHVKVRETLVSSKTY